MRIFDLTFSDGKSCRVIDPDPEGNAEESLRGYQSMFQPGYLVGRFRLLRRLLIGCRGGATVNSGGLALSSWSGWMAGNSNASGLAARSLVARHPSPPPSARIGTSTLDIVIISA